MRSGKGPLVAACAALGLAACGGGSGGVDGITTAPDGRVLAGGAEIVAADFAGRTFPLIFLYGEDGPTQSASQRGVGRLEVVDANTLILTHGGTTSRLVRTGAATFADASGNPVTMQDFGAARYLFGDTLYTRGRFFHGFETPVSARPVTARFNRISASTLIIDTDGVWNALVLNAPGTVDLTATFTGAGGTITGTLFDGDGDVDLSGDGTADDILFVRTTLSGTIGEGGFSGTVGGSGRVQPAGSATPRDANLVLGATAAEGRFFGTAAQIVAGTYGADATLAPAGLPPGAARLTGFFIADR